MITKILKFKSSFINLVRFNRYNSSTNILHPSELPQLHPLLIKRVDILKNDLQNLSIKLESQYNEEIQTNYDKISSILSKYEEFNSVRSEITELYNITDSELIKDATMEITNLQPKYTDLIKELNYHLIPPIKFAEKPCIIEMHPGVGGSEAALFTFDLLQMYINFCHFKKWKFTIISMNKNSSGFINEAILSIDEPGSYDTIRFESGVHRVQRIPETETKGRVHTSTAAVVVLPKISEGNESTLVEDEKFFKPNEIRIEYMRASGKGGQHVNTTDSAVRIVHLPTGIIVKQQDERSQPRNKAKAFALLRSKLAEIERIEEINFQKSIRNEQVSTTDRSDKIRTYNYPQNRITDHRCNFSLHDIDGCMKGNKLIEIINKLKEDDYKTRLRQLIGDYSTK
ncbi:unnamed protein product [Candida verbasci]|uniref:Peptide chain release factor 1, mitochondrial n=1 Tax=Candida verbasci TaxID=1227364 RepID=A0A9W4XBI4_9ASCO|nr:unnamed protein product [Candida verbasci]